MKICIIGNEYKQQFPLIEYGGIEASVENLVKGFHKYYNDKHKFCVIVPRIIEKGDEKYEFNIVDTDFVESSKSGQNSFTFMNEVRSYIENSPSKPDIIWSQSAWSAKSLQGIGIPVICNIHDSGGWEDNKFVFDDNIYYRFISKYIFDLTFEDSKQNAFINQVKSKSFWCYVGACDEEYDFEPTKENYILWVAGLNWGMEAKGLDVFIEMARRVPKQEFVAYGTGNASLENYLRELNKEIPNFNYKGVLSRGEQHRTVFKKAKMFAMLTKTNEAFGRVWLEAITKGTPVVGTKYGAIPENIDKKDVGFCSNDTSELIEALNKPFNYKKVYTYSEKYHVKNEVEFLLNKSNEILSK